MRPEQPGSDRRVVAQAMSEGAGEQEHDRADEQRNTRGEYTCAPKTLSF